MIGEPDPNAAENVAKLLARLVPALKAQRTALRPVMAQLRAESKMYAPKGETQEHRYIASLTHSPWGTKVATTFAQELSVSGFLANDALPGDNDPAWELWRKARMPLMQDIVIRESFEYGASFIVGLPSEDGDAIARPLPPFHTAAVYDDPVADLWPVAVLTTTAQRKTANPVAGTLYAGQYVYNLEFSDGLDTSGVTVKSSWSHASPLTPVVRFLNEIDSLGNTVGKIAPLLPLLERIQKDTYDRTLIQHKHGWKVRTIAGLSDEFSDDESKRNQEKLRLAVEDILVSSDPEARFGTLDESPLGDLIAAKEADVYELCALGPIPPSALMPGKVSNVSSEAIAELRHGFDNRVADHKEVLGEAFDQLMRVLGVQAGVQVSEDAHTRWEDRSVRSLSQAGDAWSKIVDSLEVPAEATWSRIPGVTANDIAQWKNLRTRAQGQQTLAAIFPTAPTPQPTPNPAPAQS